MMEHLIPIHVGLMGHIDHGKTQLARALSQKVSTAGLDKHPQSQQRGITIDLGFTMFVLGKYVVTLVDSPGHADLIRSVVAGAGIIDAALVVVAADEGPKVQTGEHLIVLQSMDVETIIIVVSKIDLADEKRQASVESTMRSIIADLSFKRVEYVRVSALTGAGIDRLRDVMARTVTPRPRIRDAPFLMPVDHAFSVKGHGTVATGTVLRGEAKVGDSLELMPQGQKGKIRSIQTFSEPRENTSAGDRVGLNIPDLESATISRGNYLCQPGSVRTTTSAILQTKPNPLYRGRLTKGMVVSATIGMPSVTAELVPFRTEGTTRVVEDRVEGPMSQTAVLLQREVVAETGMRVLLMRTDLPPTQMRIIGSGEIVEIPDKMMLSRKHVRSGRITRVRSADVLVKGLASRKETAEALVGSSVRTSTGRGGLLAQTFGTRGVLSAQFDGPVKVGDMVMYETMVEEEYKFGH
ncbi:MAG: selenocysteine-specific translation elongation factor [Candidatus Thorarchaeota archaeon]|nr:MAG: selenocysteine-specific translation elongation factor [Candidatus Thorarchaeota archaeon]